MNLFLFNFCLITSTNIDNSDMLKTWTDPLLRLSANLDSYDQKIKSTAQNNSKELLKTIGSKESDLSKEINYFYKAVPGHKSSQVLISNFVKILKSRFEAWPISHEKFENDIIQLFSDKDYIIDHDENFPCVAFIVLNYVKLFLLNYK